MNKKIFIALIFFVALATFSATGLTQFKAAIRQHDGNFFSRVDFLGTLANFFAASTNDKLDAASIRLVCAICSRGAYGSEEGTLMRSMLKARGWQIEQLVKKTPLADVRAYLVSRGDVKILTIAGTEKFKDVEVDFRVGRVHLYDNTTLAPDEKKIDNEIFVHKGFRDYADVVLSDGLAERLKASLEKNPHETLYITGHSLGGSVAIIVALRLADMGVDKSRLKVITFGSPAVGSSALAKAYADKIDLTRVVLKDDMISRSLRALGYVQFGKVIVYPSSNEDDHFEHKVTIYLERAIRDYYAAGGSLSHPNKDRVATPIYVSPILMLKDSVPRADRDLITLAVNESLSNYFSNLTFADKPHLELKEDQLINDDFNEFVAAARSHGCKFVLIRILRAKKIRDDLDGNRNVTLEEFFLDLNGMTLSMQTSGASTENLTVFEAALAAQENLNNDLKNFIASQK